MRTALQVSCLLVAALFASDAVEGTEVRFGDHGIAVNVPSWEYSEVRLSHYNADSLNLHLSIYTMNLSNREDQGEGILLRFSPTIDTYYEHIKEDRFNLKGIDQGQSRYSQWRLEKRGEQFDLSRILEGKDPKQIWEFRIRRGDWHSLDRYYRTKNGIYAVSVWNIEGNPQENPRLVRAFHLIQRSGAREKQDGVSESTDREKSRLLFAEGNLEEGFSYAKKAKQQYLAKDEGPRWMLIERIDLGHLRVHVHMNMGYRERNPPKDGIVRPLSFWVWSKKFPC